MRTLTLALPLILAGCASTAADLYRKPVSLTYTSTKAPAQWALCASENYRGIVRMQNDGDHYWLLLGAAHDPWNRWDFTSTGTGSKAELRSNVGINNGKGAVEACA